MPDTAISTYALAISPGWEIIEVVRIMKNLLAEKLDRNYGSRNSPAHLTLITFQAKDQHYPIILAEFQRILAGLQPFIIKFSGFGNFPPKPDSTFFIQPDEESAKQIIASFKKVRTKFRKFLQRKYTERWPVIVTINPHMSIARALFETEIRECYELFRNGFEHSFFCDSFVIRKFNLEKGQHEIIDTIPLLGHEYIEGEQMRLF